MGWIRPTDERVYVAGQGRRNGYRHFQAHRLALETSHAARPGDPPVRQGDNLACVRLGAATIPLQTTSSDAELVAILAETEPAILAVSPQYLDRAVRLVVHSPSVQRIVLFDFHPQVDEHRETLEVAKDRLARSAGPTLTLLVDVVEKGKTLPDAEWPSDDEQGDPLSILIYTSESTGSPKGAMYTETLAAGMWGGYWSQIFSDERAISIHYMPMSHVAGRSSLKNTLARGGTCYFVARSNLSSLLEDIALAKPTELSLVPRVCEMLYQRFNGELAKRLFHGGDERGHDTKVIIAYHTPEHKRNYAASRGNDTEVIRLSGS